MEHITDQCGKLIDTVGQGIFDKIASTRRDTRERAIHTLTQSLDHTSDIDGTLYQALPLEIAKRGDIIAAIWYIETIGKLGQPISVEVFGSIFHDAMLERNEREERGEVMAIHVINKSIESLFRMALSHPELQKSGKVYMMLGKYQEMKGDHFKAIEYYNSASSHQHNYAYTALALVYEKMGALDMSLSILDVGYQLSGDTDILSEMVRISCRMGDMTGALNLYWELRKKVKGEERDKIKPFIFYKGYIENEQDLVSMEEAVAKSLLQKDFVPTDDIVSLVSSAKKYVEDEIKKENESIKQVNKIESSQWQDTEYHLYNRAIVRRLWLMQIDILTLGDHRYLQHYLRDIRKLGIDGTTNTQELLRIFFDRHFSGKLIIERQLRKKPKNKNTQDTPEEEKVEKKMGNYEKDGKQEGEDEITLYQAISIHIGGIGEYFHHPEFYETHKGDIAYILAHSAMQQGEYDEEVEDELTSTLGYLADETHYYLGMRRHVAKSYDEFVGQFDAKYGMYYRRYIQSISIRSDISIESYPDILKENPEVALLFWIEKIINSTFPANDAEEVDRIVIEYGLDKLNIKNALLFGSLIFDVVSEYAIGYLADYPNMLDVPEAIYIITEGIRQMNSRDRNASIRDLHKLCQENYEARGFFEHINLTFREIAKMIELADSSGGEGGISDEDKEIFLLARGNVSILQRKEKVESLANFSIAASEFSSTEGFLQAGDSYNNMKKYDEAMHCYECAFNQDDSITCLVKILSCTIQAGRYEEAEKYIHVANQRGYSIGNYILAFYLWQGKTEDAFRQMIYMIKTKQKLIDAPEGLFNLLLETLEFTCAIPDTRDFAVENLKVQAFFIRSCILTNKSNNLDPDILLMHWRYCVSLIDEREGEELDNTVRSMLIPFTGEIDNIDRLDNPHMNDSLEYIDSHAQQVLSSIEDLFKNEVDEKIREELWKQMNEVKTLTINALKRFTGSDRYVAEWRVRLNFRSKVYGYVTQEIEEGVPPSAKYIH